MLKLFVCRNCQQFFPSPSEQRGYCPKCKGQAIPTEYFMVDLLRNNAKVTREIYRKYDIECEEFTDMMTRVDEEERLHRTLRYKIRKFLSGIKNLFILIFSKIKKIFIH